MNHAPHSHSLHNDNFHDFHDHGRDSLASNNDNDERVHITHATSDKINHKYDDDDWTIAVARQRRDAEAAGVGGQ